MRIEITDAEEPSMAGYTSVRIHDDDDNLAVEAHVAECMDFGVAETITDPETWDEVIKLAKLYRQLFDDDAEPAPARNGHGVTD